MSDTMAGRADDPYVARLRALIRAGGLLNSTLSLDAILERMMVLGTDLLQSQRATLFLLDREKEELWSKVATDLGQLAEIRVPVSQGIAGHVATTGERVLVDDAYRLPWFNPEVDHRSGFHTRSVLCVPLRDNRGAIMGVMQVLNRREGAFDEPDAEILQALADQAAVAIQTSLLHQELMLIQQLEYDVEMASEVQRLMMASDSRISAPTLEVASFFRAAHLVGGDYFEIGRAGGDQVLLAMGDVSGKGFAAALLMAGMLSSLRVLASREPSPAAILGQMNERLVERPVGNLLSTLFVACFDPRQRLLRFSNAGHAPGLLLRAGGTSIEKLDRGGLMLGVLGSQDYDQGECVLGPGDTLLLHTDGLTDAADPDGRRMGVEAVLSLFLEAASRPEASVDEVVGHLQDGIRIFTKDAAQVDDLALVVARGR